MKVANIPSSNGLMESDAKSRTDCPLLLRKVMSAP